MVSFFHKRLPWISLLLLFGSYTMIGKLLAQGKYSNEATWFLLIGSFMVAIIYLHPLTDLSKLVRRWFSSDSVAFSAFVMIAAAISIMLNWFKLFLPVMLILTTEGLARLDLQACEFSDWQTFFILILITGAGLACGWWLN